MLSCVPEHLPRTQVQEGKRGQEEIATFERNLEPNLFDLQESLPNQTYRPGGYFSFYRTEAKCRLILAAPFRDQVVHDAHLGVMENSRGSFLVGFPKPGEYPKVRLPACQTPGAGHYFSGVTMARLIPAAERISRARALIQKAYPHPVPAEGGKYDFSSRRSKIICARPKTWSSSCR
jgi:hypothetical protein